MFDFHGVARIHLVDPAQSDVEAVGRQLGVPPSPPGSDCDIVVQHHHNAPEPPQGSWIVGKESAVSTDALYVRGPRHQSWSRFEFHRSDRVVIDRGRGSGPLPLLTQLLADLSRARGVVPIHASGFVWRGKGVLVMGWSKGGKTEVVLPFMEDGATFVGDEWIFVDNGTMVGLQEPIRIWDWHLTDLPHLRSRLPARAQRRLRLLKCGEALVRTASRLPFAPRGTLPRVGDLLHRQRYVQPIPTLLWGDRTTQHVPIDHLVLTVSHNSDAVATEPIEAGRVAEHMAVSNIEEMRPLMLKAAEMRFAHPSRPGASDLVLDEETTRLETALQGIPGTLITHPYPAPTLELFRSLEQVL